MNEEEKKESPPSTDNSELQKKELNTALTDKPIVSTEIISEAGQAQIEQSETPIAIGAINYQPQTDNMEVHHHAHDPAAPHHKKNWKSYFWEFLMLFLAVFCGFLAEYQLEHKIEKQRAKEFALSLYRDITTDTVTFNTNLRNLNTSIRKIDSLIILLGNKEETEKNVKEIYRFSIYAFIFPSNKPNRSTIQQLLNSGSLRYFRSDPLIDSVKEYNKEIELYEDFRADIGNLNLEFRKAQARIIEIDPLVTTISQNNFFNPEKMYHNLLSLPGNIQLFTTEPLQLKEYANWCALKKFYMGRTVQHFQRLKNFSEAVLRLLKEQYHFS